MKEIENHFEKYIGKVDNVFHELISDKVHIDIMIINPTPERNYYTLCTMGMSAIDMNVPSELDEYKLKRAELFICLPPDFKIYDDSKDINNFEDENNYWPIRQLKSIARLPFDYNTWIGYGHSIPNGDPAEPFANNTKFCGIILGCDQFLDYDFYTLKTTDGEQINFYYLYPIYNEEMNFKLKHGADKMFDKIGKTMKTHAVDNKRKNACKIFG